MRFASAYPILAACLLLHDVVFAVPRPSRDATPQDAPLPGRSGTSVDSQGKATAYYGDDFLPQHMRHVEDNQKEFPQNAGYFPVNSDGEEDRRHKIGPNTMRAGPDPVTGFPRVKDEKPLASQKLPPGNPGTTFQLLSHKESGLAPLNKVEQEIRKEEEKKFKAIPGNENKEYEPSKAQPLPDGSHRTEIDLTKELKTKAGPDGETRLKANPGWLPLKTHGKDAQMRGHEAPAVMMTGKHEKNPNYVAPVLDQGKTAPPKTQPKQPQPQPPPDPDTRRGSLRQTTIDKGQNRPPPKGAKIQSTQQGGGQDPTKHPNYRPKNPQVESDTPVHLRPVPAEDPTRLPPRPQNRVSGPPKPAPPREKPIPTDQNGKPFAKDDTSLPTTSGSHTKLPDKQRIHRPLPAGWDKPIDISKVKSQPSGSQTGAAKTAADSKPKPQATLPQRPAPQAKPEDHPLSSSNTLSKPSSTRGKKGKRWLAFRMELAKRQLVQRELEDMGMLRRESLFGMMPSDFGTLY